jgi:hypothetical protein
MNIGNVSNNGGVDRGAERGARVDGRRSPARAAADDGAEISQDGREAAAAFDARVATATAEPAERDDRVARAMQRLLGGELDREAAVRDAAERMLGQDFRTV